MNDISLDNSMLQVDQICRYNVEDHKEKQMLTLFVPDDVDRSVILLECDDSNRLEAY